MPNQLEGHEHPEILETAHVSMMHAQRIYIAGSTLFSACQLVETIFEIEEKMDNSSSIGNYNCIVLLLP